MRVLDLGCGSGSASDGYMAAGLDAGFDVEIIGVDRLWQANYPYEFIHGDMMDFVTDPDLLAEFDLVHMSPPCQLYTRLAHLRKAQGRRPSERATDLLIQVLPLMRPLTSVNWVIENVPGAPLEDAVLVCGSAFPDLTVRRHRYFELSMPMRGHVRSTQCAHWRKPRAVGVYGVQGNSGLSSNHNTAKSKAEAMEAMGIDRKMTWREITEAIPPVYTEYIGTQIIEAGFIRG